MLDWQKNLIKTIEGCKPGELVIMATGRHVGKSIWQQMYHDTFFPDLQDLRLDNGTVMDVPYYTVEPVGGNWSEMERWVRATFGEPGDIWNIGKSDEFAWPDLSRWYMNNQKFWFRDEADRTLFVIKWR